jgi:hypothetical protein
VKRGMIDIETLSSQSDACVISIGLVGFDEAHILYRESFAIEHHSWDGHIDPRTVKWWMDQSEEAQRFSFKNEHPVNLDLARFRLNEFAARFCKDECWANGPQFDLVVLRNWWRRSATDETFPVHYRTYRDCRTIWTAAREKGADIDSAWQHPGLVPHDPKSDAEAQARAVILALAALR